MILECVTLVNATIKQAQTKQESKRDKDATFTKKRGKTYYGYTCHIGLDKGTDVIHRVELMPANMHDSDIFESVVHGKKKSVYADKGYANKKRRDKLESNGIFCGILQKGYRNKPLTKAQKGLNRHLSSVRNTVELSFSFMNAVLKYDRCKYYDFARNRFQFVINATVYNIRMLITLSHTTA